MAIGIIIALAIVAVLVVAAITFYNALVRARSSVDETFSQISVQLQRRFDLIPNLVETVKGYAKHESATLNEVTAMRQGIESDVASTDPQTASQANAAMDTMMSKINVVVENYPDLKASQNFLALQEELATTENKISFARQAYNNAVRVYNVKTETFPSNIFAGIFRFTKAEYFNVDNPEAKKAVKVSF